jgi:uncharacterized membrane protein YesL
MGIKEALRMIWKALVVWWEGWFSLLLYSIVWVLCCLTIVLGPPATFGFFHVVRLWIDEKETRWSYYFQMGKKYFLTSWIWFLANIFVFFVVFANYVFYGNMENRISRILLVVSLLIGLLWVAVQFYALPYYVLIEQKSILKAWKNGLFTILASPLFSLMLWIVLAVVIYLHVAILPLFFGGPALIVIMSSMAVEDRIQKFGIRDRETGPDAP